MPEYFRHWLREAKRLEEERTKHRGEAQSHPGFGRGDAEDEDAWGQWLDYVMWLNDGAPADETEEEDEG